MKCCSMASGDTDSQVQWFQQRTPVCVYTMKAHCWWKCLLSNAILCTICNLNVWNLTTFDNKKTDSSFGVAFLHLFKAHALPCCEPPSCPAACLVSAPLCSSVLSRPLVAWKQHWQLQLLTFSGAVKDAPALSSEEEVRENHAKHFWLRLKPWMLNYCQRCINDSHTNPEVTDISQKSHDRQEVLLDFLPINGTRRHT